MEVGAVMVQVLISAMEVAIMLGDLYQGIGQKAESKYSDCKSRILFNMKIKAC
jgi:hypothetical protein